MGKLGRDFFLKCAALCYKVRNLNQGVSHLMPSRRTRLRCSRIFALIAVVLVVPAAAEAQTGRVIVQGQVSETVALSVVPNFTQGDVDADVVSIGNTVRITLRGTDAQASVIRVPLLVRSNSSFKISAAVESTNLLTKLSIADVRATGRLVSPAAVNELLIPEQFDLEGARDLLLVSGPRISLGGTLDSPNNALQITVLIRLRPQQPHGSLVHLTFAATAAQLTQ